MTESAHYCQRCGSDAWSFYRCDDCLSEFCEDCLVFTDRSNEGICPECVEKYAAEERAAAERAKYPQSVLPSMKKWLAKQLEGACA